MQTEYNESNTDELFVNGFKKNGLNHNRNIEQRPRSTGFKSFLKWFKKIENNQKSIEDNDKSSISSFSDEDLGSNSSTSSTATVESFAFLPANVYKPYGDACQPEKYITSGPYTETYHRLIKERNLRRDLDKNLSLRKKYSLYSSGTINHKIEYIDKTVSIPNASDKFQEIKIYYDAFSLPSIIKQGNNRITNNIASSDTRKTASLSARGNKTPCHVKGKRKAPLPPGIVEQKVEINKTLRKKRQAPAPPNSTVDKNHFKIDEIKKSTEISNCDSKNNNFINNNNNYTNMPNFKCDISPKPWFKRQSSESKSKQKVEKVDSKKKGKHEFPEVGFFRCGRIFDSKKHNDNMEDKNEKRLSCFLPNISELDREAVEILKQKKELEEQLNNLNVPETNFSKPSTARDLINKFNALTNHLSKSEEKNDKIVMSSPILHTERKLISDSKLLNANAENKPKIEETIIFGDNKKCLLCSQSKINNECKSCKADVIESPKESLLKSNSSTSFQNEVFSALSNLNCSLGVEIENNMKVISIAKPSSSTSNEVDEKTRLKEMLKEMKNSLPKRPKPTKSNDNNKIDLVAKDEIQTNITESNISFKSESENQSPLLTKSIFNTNQINSIAEKYRNKPMNVINSSDNKVKAHIIDEKPDQNVRYREVSKVSSSAQTTCSVKNLDIIPDPSKIYPNIKIGSAKPKNTLIHQNDLYMNVANETKDEKEILVNIKIVLKQLEAAISDGNHELASKLAKDLALLKVKCSVTTTSPVMENQVKSIQIYIEDQFSHQGPISIKVHENIKILELKQKAYEEFHIPIMVQKWIIKKQLAINENNTIKEYNGGNFDEPLFLYVVSSDNKKRVPVNQESDKIDIISQNNNSKNEKSMQNSILPSTSSQTTHLNAKSVVIDTINKCNDTPTSSKSKQNVLSVTPLGKLNSVKKKIWVCSECTLVNSLHSPICSACGIKKSENSIIKENVDSVKVKQKVDNEHYLQLINLDNSDLVSNKQEFECSVCLNHCEEDSGVVLRECLHTFCKECLANVIKYCEEIEVKCPYRDKNYFCDSTLQEREIKALVSKNIFEKHLTKSINIAENKMQNAFHCKTPNCKGWCIFEENVNDFNCPICKKRNCLTCQAIHDGKNCKEYQQIIKNADENSSNEVQRTKKMLDEMISRGEALTCPSCQVVLIKKWGCDWVKCSMCKTEICWVTRGARWGPAGKGDISAGCQCGVNGVKCHPKCNYCH